MSETNEALRRLVAQVDVNTDVLVGGTPLQARRLLTEATDALAGRVTVVSVASPIGELSLSTLIAQLSGRLDLDDQDDAALELGLKRLRSDGQTVLTVLAPAGISRSALRYLQHVSRQSPRLAMIVYAAPSLAPALEAPGLAALRARLQASPVIEFDAPAEPAAHRAVVVVPPVPATVLLAPPPAPIAAARTRRPVLWAAAALGMAAAAGVAWLGYSAPGTAVAGGRMAHAEIPLAAAIVPLPVAADLSLPITAAAAPPPLSPRVRSFVARPAPVMLATLPAHPPSLPYPEMVAAGVVPPFHAQAQRLGPARRDLPRLARARPSWPAPRYQEPADYERARPWDGVSPIWAHRDLRRPDYLGTYAVGPNGVRIFQYDP